MRESASRRVGGVGGCPTIRAGIVSSARIQIAGAISTAPDDHFTASPDSGVRDPASGRVGDTGGCPRVRSGIVSCAGVEEAAEAGASPDDHFTASPDTRVKVPSRRHVGGAGSRPGIIDASVRPIRYCGKRIVSARRRH